MKPLQLDKKTYLEIPRRYFADPASEFMPFGEWFVRNYLKNQHDPDLFYEKNMLNAGFTISLKYLKKEENDNI